MINIQNIDKITLEIQDILLNNKQTITCAESCTGGLIASYITANSGSSSIFKGSIVTYCNEVKEQELNVSKKTMIQHGVVSCQVVEQMCQGVLKKFDADYAIAVSGVAGPTGGTENKPVGTVVIGVISKDGNKNIVQYHFKGDRESIQKQACLKAFEKTLAICSSNY